MTDKKKIELEDKIFEYGTNTILFLLYSIAIIFLLNFMWNMIFNPRFLYDVIFGFIREIQKGVIK